MRTAISAFQMEARARRVAMRVALERVKSGVRQRGQWFWVEVERFVRQSGQIRWVQGRSFGRMSEDQQTMQVGSSSVGGGEEGVRSVCRFPGLGCSVAAGWLASGRFFMNLLKLGRLPAAFD
jgi:hypothetical protein